MSEPWSGSDVRCSGSRVGPWRWPKKSVHISRSIRFAHVGVLCAQCAHTETHDMFIFEFDWVKVAASHKGASWMFIFIKHQCVCFREHHHPRAQHRPGRPHSDWSRRLLCQTPSPDSQQSSLPRLWVTLWQERLHALPLLFLWNSAGT